MHYLAFVVLPEDVDPENALAALKDILGPYDENVSDDGWWDWWLIGGRWSGYGRFTTKMELGHLVPFTLVTSEFAVHQECWDGARWVDSEAALLEAWSSVPETARIAVVDYHC